MKSLPPDTDTRTAFIEAACVPLEGGHASGNLESAEALLAAYPEIAGADIHTAAILGDDAAVRRFLERDPASATATGEPRGWDALTHLCFSRYLRLDRARSEGFVRAAAALLDAGASANTAWYETGHQPPERETALYGAAGIAHHAELTRLLLERGADPNDGEVTYHAPETYDNAAMKALVESGRLTADSLATLLLRKSDWHDLEGVRFLLEHGADPNRLTHWRFAALHQALRRDNRLEIIDLMLDHGADPSLANGSDGKSAIEIATRRGRRDALELFERRDIPLDLHGVERLLAACARCDAATVRSIAKREPALVAELMTGGGSSLAVFAGNGNTEGVGNLLDLGVNVAAPYEEGDRYFGIPKRSTALHVAAWRARHDTVKLLIERGAPPDERDANGRTALALAVRACVDSYWKDRRSPESVQALLDAGASVKDVPYPSGYEEIDRLIRPRKD